MGAVKEILKKTGFIRDTGARVPHRKNTQDMETVKMPLPDEVCIPMLMHIGAPCIPLVKKGDHVDIGTRIGDNDKGLCAPVHATVSGTVDRIDNIRLPGGQICQAVIIKSDGEGTMDKSLKAPEVESREDLVRAIRESGMVGLGGAGFPTYMKLDPKPEVRANIDTLIVNGAECEPYLTSDYRQILEDPVLIMRGIYKISEILDVKECIIAIEDNKPEAIRILSEIAALDDSIGDRVKLKVLPSMYPQGAEKIIIKSCTGREVPPGKLPSDVGVVVMNITSVAYLERYMEDGRPLLSKRITVDGGAIKEPCNVKVPIGTYIKDVAEFCGGFTEEPAEIIYGGPMMGLSVNSLNAPVMKQNNGILFLTKKEADLAAPSDCIKCGRCVNACPMGLSPVFLDREISINRTDKLESLNIMSCMECGSCSFVCPARRRLVQSIRTGKSMLRSGKGAK